MSISRKQLSVAISNLALLEDNHPTHLGDEPDKAKMFSELLTKGSSEAYYMLATYCFDVSKRFAVLHTAICKVCPDGNPTDLLAVLIEEDNRKLNAPNLSWEERATIAASQLKVWHDRAHKTNEPYIAQHAEKGRKALRELQIDFFSRAAE